MSSELYPQYYASLVAEQEFVVESPEEFASTEFREWMSSHPDAIWLRWKDGIPVGDENALKEASINAIVSDWIARNVEVREDSGQTMFRIRKEGHE